MTITFFTQYYDPEPCAAAKRITEAARAFASSGFAVEVVTGFPNFPDGKIPKRYRGKLFCVEQEGSIRVTRVWTYASPNRSRVRRALNWLSVAFGSLVAMLVRVRRGGAVYVSIPPITLVLPALLASYGAGAQLFVDVRDAYPEVGINLGMWKRDGAIAKIIAAIVTALYRRAHTIFCATEGVLEAVAARCAPDKEIQLVTNGFDRLEPAVTPPFQRSDDEFVAIYAGNMGLVSGLDVVLDAAAQLRSEQVRFVLVGDGGEAARLRDRVRDEQLDNVAFVGVVPPPVALAAVRDADISLVPLKRQIVDCLPSKMFDALRVGSPLLLSGDGEARRFIEQAGAGWCVPAEDAAQLAGALRTAAADRAACRARGEAGRAYVLANYDPRRLAARVVRQVFKAQNQWEPS